MGQAIEIPFWAIPAETVGDMVPMGVVIGLFMVVGWLLRRWKKKRGSSKKS